MSDQPLEQLNFRAADAGILPVDHLAPRRIGTVAAGAETAIDDILSTEEQLMIDTLRITRLVGGLNFGEGTISKDDRLKNIDDPLEANIVDTVETVICSQEILVPVEADDDGCGDGRGVGFISRGAEKLKRSLHRAKVFGGGLTMSLAARIGLRQASTDGLEMAYADTLTAATQVGLEFGAHTDDRAHGDNCGCGAIDKAPTIIANATKYREQISGAVAALSSDAVTEDQTEMLGEVFDSYEAYGQAIIDKPYKGSRIAEMISGAQKVVKQLLGTHQETHIVINTVAGMTVDQELVRAKTDGKAQVFAVDAWRLQEIAEKLYSDGAPAQQKAYLSMLVYTLATAGTLTKGDLPVYVIQ